MKSYVQSQNVKPRGWNGHKTCPRVNEQIPDTEAITAAVSVSPWSLPYHSYIPLSRGQTRGRARSGLADFISTHEQSVDLFFHKVSPPNGTICDAMMPATPYSRSHHQNRLGNPAHQPVFAPLPVAAGWMVMNMLRPHPCGCSGGCGYRSGRGFVKSGLAAGTPCLPKSGMCGSWLVNISCTVFSSRIRLPVVGDFPSFNSAARISGSPLASSKTRAETYTDLDTLLA